MPRLFVCIWIPDELKKAIIKFQEKMAGLRMNAKFVEKENLHLTITFLGDVEESGVDEIKSKLDTLSGFSPFRIKLAKLKVIPNEDYIRVLGIDVSDEEDKLSQLIKSVGNLVEGSYHEQSKMTLCRVRDVKDKDSLKKFIEDNRGLFIGEFIADRISLVNSVLTSDGPMYKTIHETMLKK